MRVELKSLIITAEGRISENFGNKNNKSKKKKGTELGIYKQQKWHKDFQVTYKDLLPGHMHGEWKFVLMIDGKMLYSQMLKHCWKMPVIIF